jgi:hypothetical protein
MIRREPLTIAMPDGTVSTLTVDGITDRWATVRSVMPGSPDETITFEHHPAGHMPATWRWPAVGGWAALADCRVRDWLDAHLAGRQVTQ